MAEIRLRDVPKETMQKLQKVALIIRSAKTNTQLLERMIDRIVSDQDSIKQLQTRNSQLHTAIKKYYDKENASKEVIAKFMAHVTMIERMAKGSNAVSKKLIKQFKSKR